MRQQVINQTKKDDTYNFGDFNQNDTIKAYPGEISHSF